MQRSGSGVIVGDQVRVQCGHCFTASFPNAVLSQKVSPIVGGNTVRSGKKPALSLTAAHSKRDTTSRTLATGTRVAPAALYDLNERLVGRRTGNPLRADVRNFYKVKK
jgi:hypothetical protein